MFEKGERHTDVGLAPDARQPLGELDLVPVDRLAARLPDLVGDMQKALVPALAGLLRQQDAALLERLTNRCEPVRWPVLVVGRGTQRRQVSVMKRRQVAAREDVRRCKRRRGVHPVEEQRLVGGGE